MNLRQIQVFLAVARHASFSTAAEELRIAQSAVSIAIRRLEEDLGSRLFHRSKRSVELSPAGRAFLARAQPALAQLDLARQELRAIEAGIGGSLALAAPAMVAGFALAAPLAAFQAAHPGVRVSLAQAGAGEIARRVAAGEVELGVIASEDAEPGLEIVELARFRNVACMATASRPSTGAAMSWSELLSRPIIAFPAGYHQRSRLEAHARRLGLVPGIVMETESVAVLIEAVRRGIGVATLPEPAVRDVDGVAWLPLEGNDVLSVGVCHRRDYPLSRAARALVEHLRR
ncbi:LysR family transcriptional regulator [Luteimonas sp. RD2P54]|uniref:LysR family transcriptional regulator n=1 Tax=Luteimonas endophytica TaxID=3042023 RepID=A0ABT6J9Z2_9GAMM|nr:LysR family transcriptional regulator [Luteimonas endophytica]MDH5823647.1 LysR family transcriptional regulator [Luteimonas endophytica]